MSGFVSSFITFYKSASERELNEYFATKYDNDRSLQLP